jgi:hypothetical protein
VTGDTGTGVTGAIGTGVTGDTSPEGLETPAPT